MRRTCGPWVVFIVYCLFRVVAANFMDKTEVRKHGSKEWWMDGLRGGREKRGKDLKHHD